MRRFQGWAMLIGFLIVIAGVLYLWWDLDVRWRPHVVKRNQAEIATLLAGAGWVSPGLSGPKLYLIATRDCGPCGRYEQSQFPVLQKAGVDTRVIMVARADVNGAAKSTAAERSTVAELWVNRSWPLFQSWMAADAGAWTAPHVPAADGDVGRSAVVEAGRDLVDRMSPLLKANGVTPGYPTLIWWAKDGNMEACLCQAKQTYAGVRKDLGVD
ncbi:MAG TPA: hypothetical protein VE309_11585 [Caulobacteraceae bacterium]|jgi:hypothetical protein|nr:hypothetical protein [Caulobacteraceae bacterium]